MGDCCSISWIFIIIIVIVVIFCVCQSKKKENFQGIIVQGRKDKNLCCKKCILTAADMRAQNYGDMADWFEKMCCSECRMSDY